LEGEFLDIETAQQAKGCGNRNETSQVEIAFNFQISILQAEPQRCQEVTAVESQQDIRPVSVRYPAGPSHQPDPDSIEDRITHYLVPAFS